MQLSNRTVGDFVQNNSTQKASSQRGLSLTTDQSYFYMLTSYLALRYPTGLSNVSEVEIRNHCQEIAFISAIAADEWQNFSEVWSGLGMQNQNVRQQPTRAA